MNLQIKQASKKESKLRLALMGPAGSGKTFTSLSIASELGKVLVVDTERGSASKYAGTFPEFDVIELDTFAPEMFIEAIKLGEQHGYQTIVLDSLSHAWMGKGGVLELHDNAAKRSANSFAAWRDVTPKHNELIDAILQSKCHVIATMRSKTEYVQEKDEKGRTSIKRVGMAPVQRDGMEYEFDVIADLDLDNNFIVGKTRCSALAGKVFKRAGANVAEILKLWLSGEKEKPTRVLPIQPLPATTGPANEFSKNDDSVSNETKGRLLFEGGFVSRQAWGYEVTESVNGTPVKHRVEKKNGVIVCDCLDYADGAKESETYKCAHKYAVQFYALKPQAHAA